MIEEYLKDIETEAERLNQKLYDEIAAIIIGLMTIDGKVVLNEKNLVLVGKIDNAFKSFNVKFQIPFFKRVIDSLYKLDKSYIAYLDGIGIDASQSPNFAPLIKRMNDYLRNVSLLDSVKLEVKNYLFEALSSGKGLGSIRAGMRRILGLKDISGVLNRYYNNFLFDQVMIFDRILSNSYAEENNLKYFIYSGGLIATSREFCIRRNGLVFNKENIDDWASDPTLPVTPNYNPIIDFGSYHCRHWAKWITDEQAKELMK